MAAAPLLTLTIHDVAFGGKGVARHEGKVYFVPFTAPGETVRARVVRDKKKFAEAELVSIETPSPQRVTPPCPYFGRCGGCLYQHLDYPLQLELKAAQVEQTLRRVGRLENVPMRPAIPAPHPYGYRNRIRVHVAGGVTGFFAQDAHALVDIERCPIANEEVNGALARLRKASMPEGDYSLRSRGGGPFFEQTNPEAAALLVDSVGQQIQPGQTLLVDAYCGAGLFSRPLAARFPSVVGIEENFAAIENARRSAAPHERYVHGDVAVHLGEVLRLGDAATTTVILDPPATGLESRTIDLLLSGAPSEIIYVSCNPATLARDLAGLGAAYELTAVTPLDMFPQTAEIEVVVKLVKAR